MSLLRLLLGMMLGLAACGPGTATGGLPVVGTFSLEPSGAGPCVVSAVNGDVPVYERPADDANRIALLGAGRGEVTFSYDEDGWYAISYYLDSSAAQEIVGWLPADQVSIEGDCAYLYPPAVCSVQPSVGRVIDLYAEPNRDAAVVSALGPQFSLPLLEISSEGWFGVAIEGNQVGWIAPDEGQLVGC